MSIIEKLYKPIKEELAQSGRRGIASDIDDTLSATNLHWVRELISVFQNPEGLSPEEIISKYRYAKNVPYWPSELVEAYVQEQFSTGVHLMNYPIVNGSVHSIKMINDMMGVSVYITARPDKVADATLKWLTKNSFPSAQVIGIAEEKALTQYGINNRNQWKAAVLEYLHPHVTGIIDDNEELLDHISPDYKGKVYIFSNTTKKLSPPLEVMLCSTWEKIVCEIELAAFPQ